jgi:tRNA modification GTPase
MSLLHHRNATICALSTPPGHGALAMIRVSGPEALTAVSAIFSKDLSSSNGNVIHYGNIVIGKELIDEVIAGVFRAPNSFTGEDVVEISCHGSKYIQQRILQLLLANGCVPATAGEFTMRAFMNGKMDLSQAEAIADLIASESAAAHRLAMFQLKGGFSREINQLREELIHFASMLELELDFSGEDVEFADRKQLLELTKRIGTIVRKLMDSFAFGNAVKHGIPVAIVGVPNVGKSTLLNTLLNEDKAIVSDIAGTTRDAIEDVMQINGVEFRFIDTAGLRETKDVVENIGIERTWKKVSEASILLYLVDAADSTRDEIQHVVDAFKSQLDTQKQKLIVVANKTDLHRATDAELQAKFEGMEEVLFISAKEKHNIDQLRERLFSFVSGNTFFSQDVIVTNARHHAALEKANQALAEVEQGLLQKIPSDLIAEHLRSALFHLGEITGQISTDDLLSTIFSKFCIGK